MYFHLNSLFQKLNNYNEIMIYGIGQYGMSIFDIIKKKGFKKKISCFIISDMHEIEARDIEGIPIVTLNQISNIAADSIILVGVSKKYSQEIEHSLLKFGFLGKYILLTDYENEDNIENWDGNRSFQELYEYMVQWCFCNQVEGVDSAEDIAKVEKKDFRTRDRKQIVVILRLITARTSRFIFSLKRLGYNIKVYQLKDTVPYVGEAELIRNNIELKICKSMIEILLFAQNENPLVYYIDPGERNIISKFMLMYREYFGKIVLAPYDISNLSHFRLPQPNYEWERYALENADGIVWRFFAKEALEEKLGWKFKGKSIAILDCCAEYKLPEKCYDSKVRLCCMPTHATPFLQNVTEDSPYTREATVWEIMSKIGDRKDCEFYVYLWEATDQDIMVLKQIKQRYSNFYYYIHIDHEELISQISRYDYGCDIRTIGEIPVYPQTIGVGLEHYLTEGSFRYASSNKHYDFLNANLPIIATTPVVQCSVLGSYGVIIGMNLETLDIEFLKENKKKYYENAKEAHQKLLIDNHIQRLVDFFDKI